MSFIIILLLIAGGVLISVVLPIVKEGYPKAKTELVRGQFLSTIWGIAKPYLLLGIGSVATALLIMAGMANLGEPIKAWHQALLLGYFADATLQKFK
ncbi:MAG TPA: hypothetical protein VI729_08635 [Anaerolineales bacterium]|nr:hypothetical protein [Anaerolineales bacterium]